jgi:hypothetical protein
MPARPVRVDMHRKLVIIAIGGKIGNFPFRLDPASVRSNGVTQHARSRQEVAETAWSGLPCSARPGIRLPQSASTKDNAYANGSGMCRDAA